MFKSARWRSEKNKIKAVFKLQFHATRVLEVGGESLTISLVPADVGKPTARLEKGEIREGICHWKNPVYETVKLFREPKTGKIHEKIYYFVISAGSSKAGLVGEASIDLASYAESLKPSTVSLPLRNSKSQAILHVSVQRMQENGDQREGEENEDSRNNVKDRSLKAHLSLGDADESVQTNSTEDEPFNRRLLHTVGSNRDHRASSGSDHTLSSSECSSGLNTPREFESKGNMVQPDPSSLLSSMTNDLGLQRTTSEMSTDDSLSSSRDAFPGEKSEEASSIVIEKLKSELSAFSRQAEVSGLELQTLRKQIVKESKRGQELFREVIGLKEERDLLKEECERFKAFQKRMDEVKARNKLQVEGGDPLVLMEELRQELNYEKDLNANLRIQLQKTQESNDELILAVRDLEEMLEKKNREILNLPNEELREINSKSDMGDDEEQKALEKLVKEHSDLKEAHVLEQKVTDLYNELEICRRDKDELEVQMEQLALDYEILKQENHDISYKLEQSQIQEQLKMQYECSSSYAAIHDLETQIANLESELKKQSNELLDSSVTITRLETSLKSLEQELEKQAQGYKAELEILTQKAMTAEDALRTEHETQIECLESELKKQSNTVEDSLATITKLETNVRSLEEELVLTRAKLEEEEKAIKMGTALRNNLEKQIENLESELKKQSNEFSNSLANSTRLETHVKSLEEELEKQAQRFEADLKILACDKAEKEEEAIRAENNLRKDLGTQIEKLESELEKKSNEFSDAVATIMRLETHVKSMEEELEKQAQGFDADLQILTRAKAEKEQEALKAEESLRKDLETHIEKFESELEKKSNECSDSLATNNKLEIHVKNLEEELERQAQQFEADVEVLTRAKVEQEQKAIRAEEALRKTRCQNANTAERLQEEFRRLSVEMASTFEANEKLTVKALTEANELRLQKNHLQELLQEASDEVQLVRGQYKEKLHEVSCEISLKVRQIEQMQSEIDDMSNQLKRLQNENNKLSIEVEQMEASKKETEMLLQRASLERTEMENVITFLREESDKSIQERNSFRSLKDEKESIIGNLQLELESQQSHYNELKNALLEDEVEKENLKKQVLKLIGDLNGKGDAIDCLEKMLKDKMKLLEDQIKTREASIETSVNSFLEKEKDLQCKIKDLERRLDELGGNNTSFCEHKFEKVVKDPPEMKNTAENLSIMKCTSNEIDSAIPLIGRDIEMPCEKEMETSALNAREKLEELLNEMEVLKEKNRSMEDELKEMQQRYSEISVKFAEVEGERQKLMMTVRSLKTAKKANVISL